jgi:endogenous inhibitor of DNA gyrase (YacG/DUF329 family)
MDRRTVECPSCDATGVVRLDNTLAIYRIHAYNSDPRTQQNSFTTTQPNQTLGTRQLLDRSNQSRALSLCANGHYLHIIAAHHALVPADAVLVSAPDMPAVECPSCRYQYGSQAEFTVQASPDDTDSQLVYPLREVTSHPQPSHTEVGALTSSTLSSSDRVTVPRKCPHCGHTAYLNYRSLAVDPDVSPVTIGSPADS